MKRSNRIATFGIMTGLIAGALGSFGCTGGPDSIDYVTIDAFVNYSDGTALSTGSMVVHSQIISGGGEDNTDKIPGGNQSVTLSGGYFFMKLNTAYVGLSVDKDDLSVECSADITDGTTSKTYPGLRATSCGIAFRKIDDYTKVLNISGTFKLPVPNPGTGGNSNPGGGTGGGPTALLELLTPYRKTPKGATYDRGVLRPEERHDGSGSSSYSGSAGV